MVHTQNRGYWAILLSFYVAYLLALVPLPQWALPYRPEWVPMVLIYWIIVLPSRVGIGSAWCAGLLLDILEGTVLGLNALLMVVIAYFALSLHLRLRLFSNLQQSGLIFLLLVASLLLGRWLAAINGLTAPVGWLYLMAALSSALIWPIIYWLLHWLRRAAGIH